MIKKIIKMELIQKKFNIFQNVEVIFGKKQDNYINTNISETEYMRILKQVTKLSIEQVNVKFKELLIKNYQCIIFNQQNAKYMLCYKKIYDNNLNETLMNVCKGNECNRNNDINDSIIKSCKVVPIEPLEFEFTTHYNEINLNNTFIHCIPTDDGKNSIFSVYFQKTKRKNSSIFQVYIKIKPQDLQCTNFQNIIKFIFYKNNFEM